MMRAALLGLMVLGAAARPVSSHDAANAGPDSTDAVPGDERYLRSTTIDEDELHGYPAATVGELIDLQPGVVEGHLRGGRSGETGFYYGRIPINNAFFNRAAIEIEPNMLSSVRVRPGIVDSRFGYGMSGMVVMDPRAVSGTWTGTLFAHAGAFVSDREMEFLQREVNSGSNLDLADFEISRIRFRDQVRIPSQGDVQFSASGPLLKDRLGIRVTGRYHAREGHMLGRRLFIPSDGILAFSGRPRNEWIIRSSGDESFVQLGGEERLSLAGRVALRLMPELELTYDGIHQKADRHPYDHRQKYVPDGTVREHGRAQLHALELAYGEGSNTRAWGQYAVLSDRRRSRLFETATDPRYVVQGPGNGANAFDAGGNDLARSSTLVRTHTASLGAAHRFMKVHEVRGGVEARIHSIDQAERWVEVVPGAGPRLSSNPLADNRIRVTPSELSAFAGATVQIERVTVDAGVRSSYFDPAAEIPLDWAQAASQFIPNAEGTVFFDPEEGDTIRNRQDARVQSWVSPRVRLSFPVADFTRIHFGVGRLYQMPPLQLLYENIEYEMRVGTRLPGAIVLANPGLEPEHTLHIEMGVDHRLSNGLNLEVVIFGKEIKNLVAFAFDQDAVTAALVARPLNLDIAHVRGATVSLFSPDMGSRTLSWSLDYSLLFVEGIASSTPDAYLRFMSGLDAVKTLERLDWDRRHVIDNAIVWRPTAELTLTLLNRLQSPLPYKVAVTNRPEYVVAGDDTPVQLTSHVRVWYDVPGLSDALRLFLQVDNLTDARVGRSVLSDTGISADLFEKGRNLLLNEDVEGVNTLQEFADDRFYLPPRMVSLGLALSF